MADFFSLQAAKKRPGRPGNATRLLSKSSVVRGARCIKSLYLYWHERDLADRPSQSLLAAFRSGNDIGRLAQQAFPGGVEVSREEGLEDSAQKTARLIASGKRVIYEASFIAAGVYNAMDILVKSDGGNGWKAFEVKEAASVKDKHIFDAAVQYYVMTTAGLQLDDIYILHINTAYIRRGHVDLQKLFHAESILDDVLLLQNDIARLIPVLKQLKTPGARPDIPIGPHCSEPYDCDFRGHCFAHIPEQSVFDISRLSAERKFELYRRGIIRLEDIPEDEPLTETQWLQVRATINQRAYIDTAAVRNFVRRIQYPISYLDFETTGAAVPVCDGTHPYERIPFQYSLHIQRTPGVEPEHRHFLARASGHPAGAMLESLLEALPDSGSIVTYSRYEDSVLGQLARQFPVHKKRIKAIRNRLVDLEVPFRNKYYYHPLMKGRSSIKVVLPALCPDVNYDDLEVHDGLSAGREFVRLYACNNPDEVERTRRALIAYCRMDTYAMVRLLDVLQAV